MEPVAGAKPSKVEGIKLANEYLGGFISETSFTLAARPWPSYKTDYRPMVEFETSAHGFTGGGSAWNWAYHG